MCNRNSHCILPVRVCIWHIHSHLQISAIALLVYAMTSVTMIAYLLVVRRTATAWTSPGDMLALAFKSTPSPAVKNTGAGAYRFDTWNHEMQVRDTGDAN